MKKITLFFTVVALFCMVAVSDLNGQEIKFPKASPKASVSQEIGLTEVVITYHSPAVKGRVIWGELVPFDQIWRTGANNATTIKFSHDVTIEGKSLKAGTYGLFTIPGKEEWTCIFSKQSEIWGTYEYKEDQDVLRVQVKPGKMPHNMERMAFSFADVTDNSAKVVLAWEKLSVGFTVAVETQKMVLNDIERVMGRYWVPPYQSADFAFNNEQLENAKKWIDLSVSISPAFWNTFLKAKIYRKLAKTNRDKNNAVKILKTAIQLGSKLPERQQGYVKPAKELLAEWTAKK